MNRIIRRVVAVGCMLMMLVACTAIEVAGQWQPVAKAKTAPTSIQRNASSLIQDIAATKIGALTHDSLSQLTAMGDVNGQMFGAGPGVVAIIGDAGVVASSKIKTSITKATGLSVFTAGKLIVGEGADNSVFAIDTASGQSAKLFKMNELRAARGILAGSVLQNGELGGLAFDGKFIYAGMRAGYSSSIFKIDPSTKSVVGHAWAPGPNPSALQFFKGSLFVLEANRQAVRRLDGNLKLSHARTELDITDGRGLAVTDQGVSILSPSRKSIEKLELNTSKMIQASTEMRLVNPAILQAVIEAITAPRKYAVLICGDVAESGFDEFWGDTVWFYKTLRNAGYSKENIYVLYGNGADYACPNPTYQMPGETVTDFAATPANVNMVLDGMKNGDAAHGIAKMKDNDTLFVWMFDHGGGGPTDSYLCLMGGAMWDTQFAAKANALPYASRAIFMQQCRSGGFIDNLTNAKTFVSAACRGSENAHEADAEKEFWGNQWYHHGEYNYYIISALSGHTPTGAAANADTNGNGKCCANESHVWNVNHENMPEIPQVNGVGVGSGFHIN